jgi:hypothetical protein
MPPSPESTLERPVDVALERWQLLAASVVVVSALLSLCSFLLLYCHERGMLPFAWQVLPLRHIALEEGKAYFSDLRQEWMSSHDGPSPALVLEDGVPLSQGNALHVKIRETGNGQFSFWHSRVLFSASDNSDPRSNRRHYAVYWPVPVPAKVQWIIYIVLTSLSFLACYLLATVLIPFGRPHLRGAWDCLRAHGERFLGHPSFACAVAVFAAVLLLQMMNFALYFRGPEMARSGYSIFGVPFNDARGWFNQGASLACGQGMSGRWPGIRPGYGLFLALFFTWTGPSYVLAVVVNLVLTALTAALLCRLGEKLVNRWVGFVAALGFATQELTLIYPLTLGTETLGVFFTVFTLHQLIVGVETGKRRPFFCAGGFMALGNLVRPLTLPALPFYLAGIVYGLWRSSSWRGIILRGGVFTAGLFLVIAPWLLRQWLVVGITTISDNTAEGLYAATNPRYGAWTSALYHEPDFNAESSVGERYHHFMTKARNNLRTSPGFYFHNVLSSYAACFQSLSRSARRHLSLLGLVVVLGFYGSWCMTKRTAFQAACGTAVLALVACGFVIACRSGNVGLDVVFLLLLPLVARSGAAVLHVLGLLGTILGVALFGMGNPDPRLLFVLEWGFVLSALACLHGCCTWAVGLIESNRAVEPTRSPAGDELPIIHPGQCPRWFVVLRAIVVGFVVVSSGRLAILNATTTLPPSAPRFFTSQQATSLVEAVHLRAPELLHVADRQPNQVLCRIGSLDRLKIHELEAALAGAEGKVLVLPIRLLDYQYYLPENMALPHWSRYVTARDHPRTICYFQVNGIPTPKFGDPFVPVVFRGYVPRRLYEQDAVLICRVHLDSAYQSTDEVVHFEGIALIPMDAGWHPRFDEGYYPAHPDRSGSCCDDPFER